MRVASSIPSKYLYAHAPPADRCPTRRVGGRRAAGGVWCGWSIQWADPNLDANRSDPDPDAGANPRAAPDPGTDRDSSPRTNPDSSPRTNPDSSPRTSPDPRTDPNPGADAKR